MQLTSFATDEKMAWRDHEHEVSALTWMVGGSTEVEVHRSPRQRLQYALGGQKPFCLIPTGRYCLVSSAAAPRRGIALLIGSSDVGEFLDHDDRPPNLCRLSDSFSDTQLGKLISMLWSAKHSNDEDVFLIEYLQNSITLRLLQAEGRVPNHGSHGGLSSPMRRLISAAITENLTTQLSTAALAKLAGMSQSHFHLLFKRTFGTSVHRYVLDRRIEAAMDLMRGGKQSLQEVAINTGFSSGAHFASTFKRLTNISPSSFKVERC